MALTPSTIKASLLSIFQSTMTDGTFSSGIASTVNTYCGTGQISASEITGTVTAGAFTGSGSGTVTVSIASDDIQTICDDMKASCEDVKNAWDDLQEDPDDPDLQQAYEDAKAAVKGDEYLADELSKLIDDEVTNGSFTVLISGQASTSSSTTTYTNVPTTDVEWSGSPSTIKSAILNTATSSMTNDSFATAIANGITAYLTGASITVKGEAALEGASGTAIMA